MELLTAGFQPIRVIHYVSKLVDENDTTKWRRIILRISCRIPGAMTSPSPPPERRPAHPRAVGEQPVSPAFDFGRLGDPGVSLAASTSIIYHPPTTIEDYGLKQVGPVEEHSGNDVPRSKQHFIRYRGGGDHGNSTSVQEFLKERIEPEGGYGGGVGVV